MGVFWVSFASRETLHKWLLTHAQKKVSVSLLIAAEALVCGLILLAWSLRNGMPALREGFWWYLLVTATLNIFWFGLGAKAKQLSDLSSVEPILVGGSATFVFVSERFVSTILGTPHEVITFGGCIGLVLMGVGVYVALLKPGLRFTEPLRALIAQKGVAAAFGIGFAMAVLENGLGHVHPVVTSVAGALMLGVIVQFAVSLQRGAVDLQDLGIRCAFLAAFLASWSSIFDKRATMTTSDSTFPAALIMLVVGAVYAIAAWKTKAHREHGLARVAGLSLGLGALMAVVIGSYWVALRFGQITYISPLKRAALMLTVPMAFVILGERTNMRRRAFGTALVIAGTFMLALSG